MTQSRNVGFIGLGSMGSAMAPRLLENGHDVIAYDVNPSARAAFAAAGGLAGDSVEEVGNRADMVFTSLPSPQIVRQVAAELAGTRVGIVVDLSTIGSRASAEAAGLLAQHGRSFADAPVSGGRAGALAGKLTLMLAAPAAVQEEVAPLLSHFGKVIPVGMQPGQAQTMKLINNIMSVVALAATSEGMAMGVKAGLDPHVMLDVLNMSSGQNSATRDKFPRAVVPRTFDFGFATGLSLKDVRLCLDEAQALGVPMMLGNLAKTMLDITAAQFGADADFTMMARVVEQWAGVEIG
ncbi:oxidoreductase [Sphingobium sp. 22B]|uniref:NAD(P)-dependent oxidoreductase n=1 Tax=unclassified Sphingobium TaxID=2611147 RepID=UPI0007865CF7|nr:MULTISPECIES: NAD(P)-dependent oxidoreductase [unclassified Sphingobium]KXU31189.1 oxidoreductase [Sphingobium sp. AM]KYC31024.1 oxidoreductase [Sphingobium sp. 22B]OAP30554.1 oxidoreductase [Sphingobium sp. 20006FA]